MKVLDRQLMQLLVEEHGQLGCRIALGSRLGQFPQPLLKAASTLNGSTNVEGARARCGMQPACQRTFGGNVAGVSGQPEEGRLEGILCVLRNAQDPQADAPDQGGVTADERRERVLVVRLSKRSKQFLVAAMVLGPGRDKEPKVVANNIASPRSIHRIRSLGREWTRSPSHQYRRLSTTGFSLEAFRSLKLLRTHLT